MMDHATHITIRIARGHCLAVGITPCFVGALGILLRHLGGFLPFSKNDWPFFSSRCRQSSAPPVYDRIKEFHKNVQPRRARALLSHSLVIEMCLRASCSTARLCGSQECNNPKTLPGERLPPLSVFISKTGLLFRKLNI